MKKIRFIFILASVVGLASLWSCEDYTREYLDEYDTMVYFRNGGEQTITLYSVGNNAKYDISICKSGSNIDASATARIVTMAQSQLDIYNMANETNYVQMPDECFEFLTATEFSFESFDPYQVAVVELKTDKIREYQDAAGAGIQYVLGLQVYSPQKVSPDINRLILRPEIDVPVVSFEVKGEDVYNYTTEGPEENVHTGTLTLNMPASSVEWDFDCTVEALGQDWLDAYNQENGTEYQLLPAGKFKLPETIHFEAGKATAQFDVSINRAGFALFEYFAVPMRLSGCTKPELQIDADAVYVIVVRLEAALAPVALTESMISSPYTHSSDGQGIPALIDDDATAGSWWHSYYGGGPLGDEVYGYYIDIALTSPLNVVRFTYCTRSNNNGVPSTVRIGVSNDGETWKMIGEVKSGLPTGGLAWATLPTFYDEESAFMFVRFGVAVSSGDAGGDLTTQDGTTACTALAELQLEGATL